MTFLTEKMNMTSLEDFYCSLHFKILISLTHFFGCCIGLLLDPMKLQREIEKVLCRNRESATTMLDRMMSSSMNVLTSEVNQTLFPSGLQKPFFRNCLSLMTTTGAKGGLVRVFFGFLNIVFI